MTKFLTICSGVLRKFMIDLKLFLTNIINSNNNIQNRTLSELIAFFVDNEWFGNPPEFKDGKAMLSERAIEVYMTPLNDFLATDCNINELFTRLQSKYSHTGDMLKKFVEQNKVDDDTNYYILQFLLKHLQKELVFYTDTELSALINAAVIDLTKAHGDCLTFFLSWLRKKCKTSYFKEYVMQKRYTMDIQNSAYSFDEYLELCYYLFNSEYIEEHQMYHQAALSKKYTDIWLYLSLHFICSIRYTDLQRIYHPDLPYDPEEVLERIQNGTFTLKDSNYVLLSVTERMCCLAFKPNKTKTSSSISNVKFHIPTSCEDHFGRLFALAEAHIRISGQTDEPLIKKITTYKEISKNMGEEIGDLFIESDFRSRSATKSYLQMIYMLGDEILAEEGDYTVKGAVLASLARSHKGNYGEFSSTTFEYLKDAKLSGLSPEFIAFELLERGVLSCTASMLLKIITEQQYDKLSVKEQTELIKTLHLSPCEIESLVSVVEKNNEQAQQAVQTVLQSKDSIASVLHRIATGQAFSKQNESLCLISAIKQICPYTERNHCIGCVYEISTKSTLYALVSEYNRMKQLYINSQSPLEKKKYRTLLQTILLPKLSEMLTYLRKNYGEEIFQEYEKLIKENT